MRTLWLEFKLLKEDIIKIILINSVLPILGTLLILNVYQMFLNATITNAFGLLLGKVSDFNWMYWIIMGLGYIILLQIIWKPRTKYFEYTILILHKKKYLFWINRLIITFFFTLIFLSIYFFTALFLFQSIGIDLKANFFLLIQFIFILVNLYLHGTLWVLLKMLLSSKIANILLVVLFYGGVKISKPFSPLYFSMILNFDTTMILVVLILEIGIILLFFLLIVRIGIRKDYY